MNSIIIAVESELAGIRQTICAPPCSQAVILSGYFHIAVLSICSKVIIISDTNTVSLSPLLVTDELSACR